MKSKKIKLIALFVAMVLSTDAFSVNECSTPIYLYDNRPHVDGIRQPHRAPCITYLSTEVSYDANTNQLVFTDYQAKSYYYTVKNDDNNIILEGHLDFGNQEIIYVNIDTLANGLYTLTVFYDGKEYSGAFEIEHY